MAKLLAFVAAAVMLLGGCASQPFERTASANDRLVCDYEHMDRIERVAKRTGTGIYWVNCPQATRRASL
jgi:hypothetical protein